MERICVERQLVRDKRLRWTEHEQAQVSNERLSVRGMSLRCRGVAAFRMCDCPYAAVSAYEEKRSIMERVNRILGHPVYREAIHKNEEAERERRYCHHDMAHFLDVARIAMLLAYKEEITVAKELVYAAALVHDMGRYRQYEDGTPHEQASAELAENLLRECGFDDKETAVIIDAVRSHRDAAVATEANLRGLLYRADKRSRACFACSVREQCNWSAEKKNLRLIL